MARSQKLAVYTGPGTSYIRGAKGKAMVSTNDWVNCYGLCGDWYLVEYEVNDSRYRRGYINRYEINGGDRMNDTPIPDAQVPVTFDRETDLTDDPAKSGQMLVTVAAGCQGTLHFFQGDWACVSVEGSFGRAQGYAPASALTLNVAQKERAQEDARSIADRYGVGDLYSFGSYEQDNSKSNGAEKIEWIILNKKEDGMLLLSRHILDCVPYNQERVSITWDECTLRQWMNETFFDKAFSEEERQGILTVTLANDGNPRFGTMGCDDTQDRVFALSAEEAETYLNDEIRNTTATAYARERGAKLRKELESRWVYWWLRTPGNSGDMAMVTLLKSNALDYDGNPVSPKFAGGRTNNTGVRPALWLSWTYVAEHQQADAQAQGTLIKKGVGIREEPSGDAARVTVTKIGDTVRILGKLENDEGLWYQVEYQGVTGYLNSRMLKVENDSAVPAITP